MRSPTRRVGKFLLLLGGCAVARADVALAPLFQDHAVLQCDKPIPVWGRADAGEHVTVTFKGQEVGATTTADGRWIVYLEAEPASAEPATMVVAGKNTVTLSDIVMGEVWLASGQSNMEFEVKQAQNAAQEIAAANFPLLRQIRIEHTVAAAPADSAKTVAGWQAATPQTVGTFTAVGYFFGRALQRKLSVPVGIINSTWGGTPIESWMDASALRSVASFPAIEARWQKSLAEFPGRQADYPGEMAAWEKAEAQAKATRTPNRVPRPRPLVGPGTPYALNGLFDGMIAPLQPCGLRGIIWYQGESNWPRPQEYAELFPAMIRAWRAEWGQGDVPFYFVQLANFTPDDPSGRAWAWLREAQAQALALPATGMAVTIDIGESKNIHARNKQEVGRRLALIAKSEIYGVPGDFRGPTLDRIGQEGAALRVYFKHAATGLIAHDRPVQSLEIAGVDRRFYPAAGRIDRGTLLVSAREVPQPVAVRYAWSNDPAANLYNGAGLPAEPFRSDAW